MTEQRFALPSFPDIELFSIRGVNVAAGNSVQTVAAGIHVSRGCIYLLEYAATSLLCCA